MVSTDISEKFSSILLAAGGSRRLGQSKQLLERDGETLIRRSARNLLKLGGQEVIVVTGAEESNILKELINTPVRIVHNPDWEQGMGGSISTGIRGMPGAVEGVLILLCDQWKVDLHDLRSLVQSWKTDISGVFSAKWGELDEGAFGPPVIFPNSLFGELEKLDPGQGARKLIRKYWRQVTFVEMKNAAFDVDEPEDLKRMLES